MSTPITVDVVPNRFDSFIIKLTSQLPDNWLGLRLAILLRKFVMFKMAKDGFLDVERWGFKLRLHPRDNGCEKGALFTPQMYESTERVVLEKEIADVKARSQQFIFVDVGANVGLFSFLVASKTGNDAKILAIEPDPENLRRLRFNIACNNVTIKVEPHAVGAKTGYVTFEQHHKDRGATRTVFTESQQQNLLSCFPLIDILARNGIERINALKIDIEGHEATVLIPFFKEAPKQLWPDLLLIEDTRDLWEENLFDVLLTVGYEFVSRSKLNLMYKLRRT